MTIRTLQKGEKFTLCKLEDMKHPGVLESSFSVDEHLFDGSTKFIIMKPSSSYKGAYLGYVDYVGGLITRAHPEDLLEFQVVEVKFSQKDRPTIRKIRR